MKDAHSAARCALCGGLELEYRHTNQLWSEPACMPGKCARWQLVGKSKNGGPLLRLATPPATTTDKAEETS
jgi:hypothetical protein